MDQGAMEKQSVINMSKVLGKLKVSPIGRYLTGRKIARLPKSIQQGSLDSLAEEVGVLSQQQKPMSRLLNRPYFHWKDRLAGGIAGGTAAGVADAKLREHSGSWLDRLGRGASAATGAWAGGKGLNATLNTVRKYIAAKSPLHGYSIQSPGVMQAIKDYVNYGVRGRERTDYIKSTIDRLKALGPEKKILGKTPATARTAASAADDVLSGPNAIYASPDAARAVSDFHGSAARHELLKRYLGIFKETRNSYFVRDPVTKAYKYNPKTVSPGTSAHRVLVEDPLAGQPWIFQGGSKSPPRYTSKGPGPIAQVFGSHDMRSSGKLKELAGGGQRGRYVIGDTWNVKLDPNERDITAYAKGLLKTSPQRWMEYLRQPARLTEESLQRAGGSGNIGGRMQSAAMRSVMENVFRQHTPVFRQRVGVDFDPYGQISRTVAL